MTRSRLRLVFGAVALLIAIAIVGACGSQGAEQQDQPATSYEAGETETTERPDRQSSVQTAQQAEEAEQPTVDTQETEADPEPDGAPVEVLRRHREGLTAERNVIGDPDAPILVVEYSDFQ